MMVGYFHFFELIMAEWYSMMFEGNHSLSTLFLVLIVIQSISWITTIEVINISDVPPLII
ncbi:hypothetical protein IFM89_023541, partial [Coptis chinensis]